MLYKFIFVAAIVIESIFVPLFLKAQWPEKTNKSLLYKMICATMFMTAAAMAVLISGNSSYFVKLLLAALALGWVGDLFLHLRGGKVTYVIGGMAFLSGHVIYTKAYIDMCKSVDAGWSFFNTWHIVSFLAIMTAVIILISAKYKKLDKAFALPWVFYSAVLTIMFIVSISFSVTFISSGYIPLALMIGIGATLFTISDATIAVLDFGEVKSFPLKCVNIVTYFAGQTILASSILFLNL
ncbi:MAG: lysoplasmalogenase [Oscillospiraceae bacterium]|jgi:uncharacterized membrane protein YhhN|nr:lysoplasmalogenase [Oscillospiraceae bacterium]